MQMQRRPPCQRISGGMGIDESDGTSGLRMAEGDGQSLGKWKWR